MVMATLLRVFTVVAASSRCCRACLELRRRICAPSKNLNKSTTPWTGRQCFRTRSCYARYSVINEDSRSVQIKPDGASEKSRTLHSHEDTIAAIVTSMGGREGSVAIVRLSGSSAVAITRRHFRPARNPSKRGTSSLDAQCWQPKSHYVQYGSLVDVSGSILDEVLVVPMLAPRSYTREDVLEVQCHGGDVCVRRILQLCIESGARLAQPGEFTLRAFLNGRLDLPQAESVAQLVSARSSLAAETALAGMRGGFSALVQALRLECLGSKNEPPADHERWAALKAKLRSIISNSQKLSRGSNRIGHTLGVDLGDSKTGVAVSLTGFAPRPLHVLKLKGEKLIEGLLQIATKERADEFVLGLPISQDGKETLQSNKARSFAGRLATRAAQRGWRVYLVNEFGSSQDGLDQMLEIGVKKRSRRQMSDAYAAMALLRIYFSAEGAQAHLVVPKGLVNQETLCLGDRNAHVAWDEDYESV